MRCAHYACRCARAAELAELADRTGNPRHLAAAVDVHRLEELVECRAELRPYAELHRRAFEDNARDAGVL